ncbi:MAG: recombinase family protein [Candidatus Poribacteria bacterium]
MSNPPYIGIYLRVSTTEQNTDLQSLEIKQYVHARGWDQVAVYEDKATGTHAGRPAFQRLMKDAKGRKLDVVVCWKLDRFSRSLKDLVVTLQELAEVGVAFISIRDQVDLTTSAGRLMPHMVGAFAEFEASLIRERVMAGLKAARALGRPTTRNNEKIRALRSRELSYRAIQRKLGISKGAICRSLAAPKSLSASAAQTCKTMRSEHGT